MHSTLIIVEPKLVVDTLLCPKFIVFDTLVYRENGYMVTNFSVNWVIEGNIGGPLPPI